MHNQERSEAGVSPRSGGMGGGMRPLGLLLAVALPGCVLAVVFRLLTMGEQLPQTDGVEPGELLTVTPLPQAMGLGLWIAVMAATAGVLVCGIWAIARKRSVAKGIWVAVSVFYSAWLALVLKSLYAGFSMSTTDPWLVVCVLCVIPIFYSIGCVVVWLTPLDRSQSLGKSLLPFIAVPVLWYLIINSLRYSVKGHALTVVLLLALAATYCFVFGLLRVVYLLIRRQDGARGVLRVVVLFVLPLLGLLVTQIAPDFSFFWDFSSPVYYILVVANGVLMLLPKPGRASLAALLFFGRCVTYVFVLYFFVCLAPFYPLSFLAVLLFGLGLLVLAPVLLIAYQTKVLVEQARELAASWNRVGTVAAAVVGVLVLPVCVLLYLQLPKANLIRATEYLQGNDAVVGADAGPVDIDRLERTMDYARRGGDEMRFNYTYRSQTRRPPPILSTLHNRVVDTETRLGDETVKAGLRALYFHDDNDLTGYSWISGIRETERVVLEEVEVETRREGDFYRSTVHLTLRESTEIEEDEYFYYELSPTAVEYRTAFQLPQGVFVSDYYLDVLGERKSGILSERSSALWIYDEVVSTALDPGLLYYNGDSMALRVFPFNWNEERRTGIEFVHKGPVTFELDGHTVRLAPEAAEPAEPVYSGNAAYISAAVKNKLPTLHRRPLYNFVVDCAADADVEVYAKRLRAYCADNSLAPEDVTVTALNFRRAAWPMTQENWEESLLAFGTAGGFGFAQAADAICREYDDPDTYPVFILVTDDYRKALLPDDTAYLQSRSPELDGYYVLGELYDDKEMFLCPFTQSLYRDEFPKPDNSAVMRVLRLDGGEYYLRDDGQPEIVLLGDTAERDTALTPGSWDTALALLGEYRRTLDYGGEEKKAAQIALVKDSIRAHVLTPLTSLIVLETKEQEEQMLDRQRRLLESGDLEKRVEEDVNEYYAEPYDDGSWETPEPSLLVCGVMVVAIVWVRRRRERKSAAAGAAH